MGNSNSPRPSKRVKATVDLDAPMPNNYIDVWTSLEQDENDLKTPGTLFGSLAKRAWFVREAYIKLYDDIMNDQRYHTQIVNGTAGIGKSSFLLYVLARVRFTGKSALLHYHRNTKAQPLTIFFPGEGGVPVELMSSSPTFIQTFERWYQRIGEEQSFFLVDGIVSFISMDYPVKYITAKSPSCDIAFMEKDQNRFDRWLEFWSRTELLSYADQVGIPFAAEIIDGNMIHMGGVCRYALARNAAQDAVINAISDVGAVELYNVVNTSLVAKYNQQKIFDRLIHRHPPPEKVGVYGTTFTFASEFVATRVAMALCLETNIETAVLLRKLQRVGPAGSMRGVLFEAYAARKIAAGGLFCVKEIGSSEEKKLGLPLTTVLQKNTTILNKTHYPPNEIEDKLIWPNPDYNMPTIDMFMLLRQTCIALQMTVAHSHGLDLNGTKAFLKYFDSVCQELFPKQGKPKDYSLYFAVPPDIYDSFSIAEQPITGAYGGTLHTQESTNVGARVKQWIMKIE